MKMSKICMQMSISILGMGVLLVSLSGPLAEAQENPATQLFSTREGAVHTQLAEQKGVIRSHVVDVNLEDVTGLGPGSRIVLELFPGESHIGVLEQVEKRTAVSYSWFGRIEGQPMGYFNIVVEGGVMLGNIHPEGVKPFELRFGPEGVQVIRQVQPDDSISCGVGEEHRVSTQAPAAPDVPEPQPDSGAFVDVMVVYTAAAETAAGGQTALNALVQLSIDTSNTGYNLSGVSHRLRLAGRRQVAYNEAGANFNTHLNRLTTTAEGFMDNVHTWRNDYAADLVELLVNDTDGGNTFGLAWVIGGSGQAANGFGVIDQGFAASATNWSFAHEVGHNLGSDHDVGDAALALLTYALGHSFNGNTQGLLRTIMARRALGGTRIQRFSNPNVNFDGQPTGIAVGQPNEADNRSAFAVSDGNVANYRSELPRIVWVDFDYNGLFKFGTEAFPYNSITVAEDKVGWGGTIRIKASSSPVTPTLGSTRAFTIEGSGGTATIGQ